MDSTLNLRGTEQVIKVIFTGRREDENGVNTVLKCEILNKNFKYKKQCFEKLACFHFHRNIYVTGHLKTFALPDVIKTGFKQLLGNIMGTEIRPD